MIGTTSFTLITYGLLALVGLLYLLLLRAFFTDNKESKRDPD